MKLTSDNPALTAYALGELSPSEARAVASALDDDPSLARDYEELSGLAGLLGETLGGGKLTLGQDRHDEIFKSGHRPDPKVLLLDHKRRSRKQSLLAVAGVAAVVVAGFMGLSQLGVEAPGKKAGGSDAAGRASPGEVGNVPEKVASPGADLVHPAVNPTVALPLNVGRAVPSMVEESIARRHQLPEPDQFKIAEWINLTQPTSSPQIVVGNVAANAELGPCPWNSERTLLMVNLRASDESKASLKAKLTLDPSRVKSALMVGGGESASLVSQVRHQLEGSRTWLYELELIPGDEKLGSIKLEAVGRDGAALSGYLPFGSSPVSNEATSSNFKVARTLASFARWGAGEERDSQRLAEMGQSARELLTEVTDEKARYALDAILQAEEYLISR